MAKRLCSLLLLLTLSRWAQQSAAWTPSSNHSGELEAPAGELTEAPDKECAGDRAEALEAGRQCSRRCKRGLACENARKQCLCDGLCGMSCIKPDLSCPEPPKVGLGDYAPAAREPARFNSRIVYTCRPGAFLFGSRERTCQGDEEWSGTAALCSPEPVCRNAPKVNHARNPADADYRLGERVSYSCYPGYQSRASSAATCRLLAANHTGWLWDGAPFRCIPKSCPEPGLVENGRRHGESFIIASSVLYTCNEGFEMVGQARRYCQSDSQWSGQPPQCEPITCNPTGHLENGKINYAYPLVYNSTVDYSCDYGFRLVGPARRRCGAERKLIGAIPSCLEIDCGELGPLHNGYVRGHSSRIGDRKEFSCAPNTTFVGGHNSSLCLETGRWSQPLPACLGPCTVPHIEHAAGQFAVAAAQVRQQPAGPLKLDRLEAGAQVPHDTYLEVVCEKDYELDGASLARGSHYAPLCSNETWSHAAQCKPASCGQLPASPRNGRLRVLSVEHGAWAHFYCLDGFRLKGDQSTQCQRGNWSAASANCVEIYCGYPGAVEHGRVLLVGLTGMYDYKPYIRRISHNRQIAYECELGYRLADGAPAGATCVDGAWKPAGLPVCVKE